MGKKKKKDNLQNGRILAGTASMENSMKVPQKTKNRITIGSSNHTLGPIHREIIQKLCNPMFTAALFTIAKTWKPKFPLTDEWIKNM